MTIDRSSLLDLIGYNPSTIPADDFEGDMHFSGYEAAAAAAGVALPLSAAEWIAAMERRERVIQGHILAVNQWADDRPEEAADMIADFRRQLRETQSRKAHYQTQMEGLN